MQFQNYINIEGRIVANPELKIAKSGKKYTKFSICFNDYYKIFDNSSGKDVWKQYPNFFECVAFDNIAVAVSSFIKGQLISVIGKLEYSTYKKQDGTIKKNVSIIVSTAKKILIEKIGSELKSNPSFNNQNSNQNNNSSSKKASVKTESVNNAKSIIAGRKEEVIF